MILGWLDSGRTDRWVIVDALYPWPALHHGRAALREWGDRQTQLRWRERSAGPRKMPWPVKSAVKEAGVVELRVWPCGVHGSPRCWEADDAVWRAPLTELAEFMASKLGCEVQTEWMGGDVIERAVTAPSLRDQGGFIGWGKGEREPGEAHVPGPTLNMNVTMNGLGFLEQGERHWL